MYKTIACDYKTPTKYYDYDYDYDGSADQGAGG